MLDKEKPLDVCKIEARNLAEHKVKYDNVSMTKALKAISKEADIPLGTLKRWIYPNGNNKYEKGRRQKKVGPPKKDRSADLTKKSSLIESTVDSIVLTDKKLLKSIRALECDTGMPVNDIIALGIESYKHTYL